MSYLSSRAGFIDDGGISAAKDQIRLEVKAAKKTLTDSFKIQQAKIVFSKIEQTPEFKQAKTDRKSVV